MLVRYTPETKDMVSIFVDLVSVDSMDGHDISDWKKPNPNERT